MENLEKVITVCKKLNIKKKIVMGYINDDLITYEVRGGSYYVFLFEIKKLMKQNTNPNTKPLPPIISKILCEINKDFNSYKKIFDSGLVSDLERIVNEVSKGKNTLTTEESQILLDFSNKHSKEFSTYIETVDYDRLEDDTIRYYNELYKKYFGRWKMFKEFESSIKCEKFILQHYLLDNYNLLYLEDDTTYDDFEIIRETKNYFYDDDETNSLIVDSMSKGIGVVVLEI
ncbi:MAG: hypothetical protein NTW78_06125 [Campylobacterales bacterium]|nr:hypothetical protein [Campylobacterales bacterium]